VGRDQGYCQIPYRYRMTPKVNGTEKEKLPFMDFLVYQVAYRISRRRRAWLICHTAG
jgi:hypothetical protein